MQTTEVIKYRGKLQFITHKTERYDELEGARLVLEGGCRWIQLRMKDAAPAEVLEIAGKMRQLCDEYDATLILDDHVGLVKEVKADGVHLGLNDMPIAEARRVLGEEYIIGGTANTADDALMHYRNSADYVGCGPFRFTTTKKNLSPVLGLDGYKAVMQRLSDELVVMPVVAIGGITFDDIADVLQSGVDGIALSGTVLNSPNPTLETQRIVRLLNQLV